MSQQQYMFRRPKMLIFIIVLSKAFFMEMIMQKLFFLLKKLVLVENIYILTRSSSTKTCSRTMVNHKRLLNKSFKIPPNFSMVISGCSIYYSFKACNQIDKRVTQKHHQWDIVLHWHRIHSFFFRKRWTSFTFCELFLNRWIFSNRWTFLIKLDEKISEMMNFSNSWSFSKFDKLFLIKK